VNLELIINLVILAILLDYWLEKRVVRPWKKRWANKSKPKIISESYYDPKTGHSWRR
jgi:hypothetical protein